MNLFTRTKCIASVSLVVAAAAGSAIAAEQPGPSSTETPEPTSTEGQAPKTCEGNEGTTEGNEGTTETTPESWTTMPGAPVGPAMPESPYGATGIPAQPYGSTSIPAEPYGSTTPPSSSEPGMPGTPYGTTPTPTPYGTTTPVTPATTQGAAGNQFGPRKLIADALSKVCLSDEQRSAIEQLGKTVAPHEQAVASARHAFLRDLAEQLRSGAIDDSALRDEIDALVQARQEASPVLHKALDDLHGILDPGQRATFADALEARMKEIGDASHSWFDQFAKDLNLSDDQKSKIQDVLAKGKPGLEKEIALDKSAFDAFKTNHFSMDELVPVSEVGDKTRARAERMVANAKEIASILTPEQRSALADRIESKFGENKVGQVSAGEDVGNSQQAFVARAGGFRAGGVGAAGFRAGAVGGWGGGYGVRGGYAAVGGGYGVGYPMVGGYGPGIW